MNLTYKFFIGLTLFTTVLKAQTVSVSTASQLQTALNNAVAGQTILLTASSYVSADGFTAKSGANGTASKPITIKSTVNSSLSTGSTSDSSYGLYLPKNNYWVIDGIQVINSKKAIMLDYSNYNVIKNVTINNIGEEGIHLRKFSSNNTISNCHFDNTGKITPGYGEGIYFGSAYSNWETYTDGEIDKCDYNIAEFNTFGDNVTAENIDVKEGTSYGIIRGNIFNGKGLDNYNYADSFIDLKGNYYTVECNTGADGMTDGIQTHVVWPGWGNYNTFRNNNFNVGNSSSGYAINVQTSSSSNGSANNNVVCKNNSYTNAKGLSNITTTTCSTTTCPTNTLSLSENTLENTSKNILFFPNPMTSELTINSAVGFNNASIVFYDATGKIVKTISKVTTNSILINRANLQRGIYFVAISEGNTILTKEKILVK